MEGIRIMLDAQACKRRTVAGCLFFAASVGVASGIVYFLVHQALEEGTKPDTRPKQVCIETHQHLNKNTSMVICGVPVNNY